MSALVDHRAFLVALAEAGYFAAASYDPSAFIEIARNRFNVSWQQALDELIAAGLVQFRYSNDPTLHPRDSLDYWRASLTEAGKTLLANGA
jgi:hypothetical protein